MKMPKIDTFMTNLKCLVWGSYYEPYKFFVGDVVVGLGWLLVWGLQQAVVRLTSESVLRVRSQ